MIKPSIPKGTRDFLPYEVACRRYIFDTIEEVFKRYGYRGIETPVMENLSTLTGKYGEEGDQLLFKVLNNGDYLAKADEAALAAKNSNALIPSISKRGLRYDLTVPFARYVVMHQHELQFPFKRYAIMPVWRADRPQRGRYQEFYQCDGDVVGSNSLLYEAEMILMIDEVFVKLGIAVDIKINNRKLLQAIAEVNGFGEKFVDFSVAIDKLDKIGEEKVILEMQGRGISQENAQTAINMLSISRLDELSLAIGTHEIGQKGIQELRSMHEYLDPVGIKNSLALDLSLARGLSYYTGCILEVKARDVEMGSIAGGGRYDDLTGVFGMGGMSGVGISFGAERIYDVMVEKNLFTDNKIETTSVIFLAFDELSHLYAFKACQHIRHMGISADIYPDVHKMKKQMKYAADMGYKLVVRVGENERNNQTYSLKNLNTGDQETVSLEALKAALKR